MKATTVVKAKLNDQLEGWLGIAQQDSACDEAPSPVTGEDEYMALALELNRCLKVWRTQARNVIARRDYLIQLGLASYR